MIVGERMSECCPSKIELECGYELEDGQDFLTYKPILVRINAYGHATVMAQPGTDYEVDVEKVDFSDWDESEVDIDEDPAKWQYRDIDKPCRKFNFQLWLKEHVKNCEKCRSLLKPWEYPRPECEKKITDWVLL